MKGTIGNAGASPQTHCLFKNSIMLFEMKNVHDTTHERLHARTLEKVSTIHHRKVSTILLTKSLHYTTQKTVPKVERFNAAPSPQTSRRAGERHPSMLKISRKMKSNPKDRWHVDPRTKEHVSRNITREQRQKHVSRGGTTRHHIWQWKITTAPWSMRTE